MKKISFFSILSRLYSHILLSSALATHMTKKGGRKRGVTKKGAEKIARQVAYRMIPKKINWTQGTDFGAGAAGITNDTPWLMIKPCQIDQADNNYSRLGDTVFIEKCAGFFNLSFQATTVNRVEVRELVGFYKGSSDHLRKAAAGFGITDLTTDLPNKMATWDRDNYFIKHDKQYDLMPLQVYNTATGDNTNTPTGIWRSKKIVLAHHLYRKYRYTNQAEGSGTGTGDAVEGDYATDNAPVGWQPFIALQVRCPDQDFTFATGSNPGPYIDYKFSTVFKDLQ